MSYIWPIMMVFSFFCAIATGNMGNLSSAIVSGGTDAVTLALKLAGIICLWNGLINIADKSGLTKALCRLMNPILRIIFPKLRDREAKEAIAMNMTANLLGLDNAATPLGLKAMKRLQELNKSKDVASDDMARFVVVNTASLHLFSTTVALLRADYGSKSPTEILLPALITSAISITAGIFATSIFKRFFK